MSCVSIYRLLELNKLCVYIMNTSTVIFGRRDELRVHIFCDFLANTPNLCSAAAACHIHELGRREASRHIPAIHPALFLSGPPSLRFAENTLHAPSLVLPPQVCQLCPITIRLDQGISRP